MVVLYLLVYMYYFGYTLAPGEERDRRGIPVKMWQGKGNTCSGLIIASASAERSVVALAIALWYWAGNQSAARYLFRCRRRGWPATIRIPIFHATGINFRDIFREIIYGN
jgi:hypothetical protein